jgi:4-hydroxy-tetrahydrodipicolinate reductase
MGRAILQEAADQADLQIMGALVEEAPEKALPAGPPLFTGAQEALAAGPGAVVLEFTTSEAALLHLRAVTESGNPIVLGTTGLGSEGERVVDETANRVPVVVAPNTSTGVTLLTSALKALADGKTLGWEASILDLHHRGKRDAPSGTARVLAEILQARGWNPEITSLREGDAIGEHTIRLVGDHEELVFTHRAFSRKVFAQGALLAARFAATAVPGRYTMKDVLGLMKD